MSRLPLPPGPPGVSNNPIALLKYFSEFRNDSIGFVRRRFDTYGDIYRTTFRGTPLYVTRDPDLIWEVLVTKGASYGKPTKGLGARQLQRFLGNGLVTSNGDFWRRQRRMINPAFLKQRVDALAPTMVEHAARTANQWRPGREIDVSTEMMSLTLAIVCKTLFDHDSRGQADRVGAALAEFRNFSGAPALIPSWVPLPSVRRVHRAVESIDRIVYDLIDARQSEPKETLEARRDLLSTLVLLTDDEASSETEATMSRKQLRDEILTMFLAGHETTSQALTWTWYLLSQHPEIEARLHEELDDVLGGRPPRVDDKLPYTERVLAEAMRLYPPVCVVPRVAIEDTELGGYHVPAGADVISWIYLTHHDAKWYPDPERFDPDRFLPERMNRLPKGAYVPFGAGQRLCIGRGFALMEARLLLATLAQRFSLSLVPGHPVEKQIAVTLAPRHGMKMIPHVRTQPATQAFAAGV